MPPSPELLLSLSPSVLLDLVATFSGTASEAGATHAALVRSLFTQIPSKKLARVLSLIAPFLTRSGRLALHEAAVASSFPDADALLSRPHADAAALLAIELERASSPARRRAIRRLFALASLRVARDLPERPTYELLAESTSTSTSTSTPTSSPSEDRVLSLLRRALGPLLLDAWSTRDPDGTLRFALFLAQPSESRLTLLAPAASPTLPTRAPKTARRATPKSPALTPHAETPVAADLLRVSPDGARFALTLAQPHLLPLYARALSLSLRPSFTLRPLQTLSLADLPRIARETPGLAGLDVVGARQRNPSDRRVEWRGPDALDASLYGTATRTGYIDRATLRALTDSGDGVDAFFQLPYRVELSDRAHEVAFRAALAAIGLFSPGVLPDDARSLAPYEHGDWRWRAVVGDAVFEQLCKAKLLVRTQSKHVATHEHRMHGAGYVVRDVPGEPELQYALAEDRALGARLVTAKDRVAWKLDLRALAAAMTRDLGAQPAPSPLTLPGVLDLGVVALPSARLRIVYAMAEPPAGWVDAVRRACGATATPVVLAPKGCAGEAAGLLAIELDVAEQLGARRIGRALGKAAEALDLAKEVPAWRLYDEDVVVETAAQRVWVRGVLVPLSDAPYRLLEMLAREARVWPTKELGGKLSAGGYPDEAARRIKMKLEAQVGACLKRAGDAWDARQIVVTEGKKGYRLGVSVRIVA